MKTILFFDRCELTDQFISISKWLKDKFNVIHVAYSSVEVDKLKKAGIIDFYNYTDLFSQNIEKVKLDKDILIDIDKVIIESSNGRFNLNASIQSDRGFSLLTYQESLLLAQSHYLAWKYIFDKQKVDLMYHEICSQFMVHIAALLCKSQCGKFIDFIQCASDIDGYRYLCIDGENFECPGMKNRYDYLMANQEEIDHKRVDIFLQNFRKDYSVFFESEFNLKTSKFKLFSEGIIRKLSKLKHANDFDRLKNNIDYWMNQRNEPFNKLKNLREYKRLNIVFETEIPKNETYYYYSIHLEPEATVLYLGDGIYANQIKLIENIAASLPAGSFLYVKDHPHEYAYRKANDYERLLRVPNIRLFHQSIPGKKLIANAKGVFSINGTAGYEALLLNKQVYCFGNSYYSFQSRVNYVENIRELRSIVYNLKNVEYKDDVELYAFCYAFLESSHEGYVDYFGGRTKKLGINDEHNGKVIAADIIKEFDA